MHGPNRFSIPAMREFVPEKARPWIVLIFVIIFQFSGGIYLSAVGEMVGSLSLLQEDIMMAGYASLAGMGLTFTVMFRLKFRFETKTALQTCAAVIISANIICMCTRSVPVLIVTCFIAGIFRMWATFECNSTIQLWLTPQRDLSVFFCFIYILVQSCMQLSGMLTVYTTFWSKWEYMHLLIVGLLLILMLATRILLRSFRGIKKLPLYGIDWLGGVMWGITLLCILFVLVYGEHYDWFDSIYIRAALAAAVIITGLNLWRSSFIRHPFISLDVWRQPAVYTTALIYIVVNLLLAPGHLLDHILMTEILHYDEPNLISLNLASLAGIFTGCFFTWQTFARRKWPYKRMTAIAFACITVYLMIFYFTIDYNLSKSALAFPIFFRNVGYVIIGIIFLTVLSRVPFSIFPQALSVQSFMSASVGSVLGSAILTRILLVIQTRNNVWLGETLDNVNPLSGRIPFSEIYGLLHKQALIVSMKEIYGWLIWISLFCLALFLIRENSERPIRALQPPFRRIRRYIAHSLNDIQKSGTFGE